MNLTVIIDTGMQTFHDFSRRMTSHACHSVILEEHTDALAVVNTPDGLLQC